MAAILLSGALSAASRPATLLAAPAATSMSSREQALQALNRLAFGPRPGDVERVLEMGVSRWIDSQVKPDTTPDTLLSARLQVLPTLTMSSQEIFDVYEKPVRDARRQRRLAAGKGTMSDGTPAAEDLPVGDERERIAPEKRPRRVIEELSKARVLRAAYSDHQLNEVLLDFWMNHFNVYAPKGLDRVFITSFERDVVRPRIWGRFEDLLMATAKSPAMLFYLDNARSVADPEHRPQGRRWAAAPFAGGTMTDTAGPESARPPVRRGGLNENYAREL
ncbi:MAG: DUF1800 family protein, partial [Acidobacteriota bacterium]